VAAVTGVAAADTAEATRLKAASKVPVEATRVAMMIMPAQAEVATAEVVATVDPAVVPALTGEVATKTQVAQEEDMAVVTTTPMLMISLLMAAMVDLAMAHLV